MTENFAFPRVTEFKESAQCEVLVHVRGSVARSWHSYKMLKSGLPYATET